MRRNKVALAFGVLFIAIVVLCLAAPLWADHVAHTTPDANHITDTIDVDGQQVDIVVARRHADRTRACGASTCSAPTRTAAT